MNTKIIYSVDATVITFHAAIATIGEIAFWFFSPHKYGLKVENVFVETTALMAWWGVAFLAFALRADIGKQSINSVDFQQEGQWPPAPKRESSPE